MPPIPFAPSHQSPFKSTLSSSQQHRSNHCSDLEGVELSVRDIEPSQWTYHCEGGKNVLLSLDSSSTSSRFIVNNRPLALRIAKSHPSSKARTDDADRFTQEIITPLLGGPSVLPITIALPLKDSRDQATIDAIAAKIELNRPAFRRESSQRIHAGSLTQVHAIEDVTAPSIGGDEETLCVEIKPKWGFLPRIDSIPPSSPYIDIKAKYSRYKMHRVAKSAKAGDAMTAKQFNEIYDPLDLYSPDQSRKKTAVAALYQDWRTSHGMTNSLRLFWNGKIVTPDDQGTVATIGSFLQDQVETRSENDDAFLRSLTNMLVSELSKRQIPPLDARHSPCTIMDRLAHLQSLLDSLDVEGLARFWFEVTQCTTLGDLGLGQQQLDPVPVSVLLSQPTVEQLKVSLADVLTPDIKVETLPEETSVQVLARHIHRFLLSSTFKDCSLLIRCVRTREGELQTSTKVIDLDMKSFANLAKFQSTDEMVCSEFLKWKVGLTTEPVASLAPAASRAPASS